MSGYENGVYRDGALYVIALKGGLRKRYGKYTVVFRAPYRTVLGGRSLDLMVAVELPPQAKRGTGFEVTVNPRLASDAVLEELLLLEWYVDRIDQKSGRMIGKSIGQPVGVWTYKEGISLVACVTGGPTRPLKEWLKISKSGDDLGLATRLYAQAQTPLVQNVAPHRRLEGRLGGGSARKQSPLETLYPFRNSFTEIPEMPSVSPVNDPASRVGSSASKPEDDVARAMRRLPGDLKQACEKLDFRNLRQFIDNCLRGTGPDKVAGGPDVDARPPRSEEEFLGLVGLLREKADHPNLPNLVPDPGPAPPFPPFEPSEELRALREEQGRLDMALQSALRDPEATTRSIKNLRRKLGIFASKANNLEATETAEHEKRRDTHLRSHRKVLSAHKQSVRERKDGLRRHHKLRGRREEIVARVERDVRRAFKAGSVGRSGVGLQSARRLPWLLLPPGELSVERLRSHYATLAQRDPDFRYEPERIEKAFLLEPEQCYVGTNEFDGYVVFTFAETDRVLLECPIYGNAVYVLGRNWKHLSKLSKGELLSGHLGGVTKIVHKGDWFARVVYALGLK